MVIKIIKYNYTNGCYKEHRNPSLPARLGKTLLDKCPSRWYNYHPSLLDLNLSVVLEK